MFRHFKLYLLAGTLISCIVIATSLTVTAQCCSGGGSAGIDGVSGGFESTWYIVEPEAIYLTVHVPETALVFVNRDPTAMGGTTRYFVIRHLEAGKQYKFDVAAQTKNAANIDLEETTSFVLTAGERKTVTLSPYKRKPIQEEVPPPPPTPLSGV